MHGLANCLEKDGGHLDDTSEGDKAEEDAGSLFTKEPVVFGVGDVCRLAKHCHNGFRSGLKEDCGHHADDDGAKQRKTKKQA